MIACPPATICAGPPPPPPPALRAPKCPTPTRRRPLVECIRPDGTVIVRRYHR